MPQGIFVVIDWHCSILCHLRQLQLHGVQLQSECAARRTQSSSQQNIGRAHHRPRPTGLRARQHHQHQLRHAHLLYLYSPDTMLHRASGQIHHWCHAFDNLPYDFWRLHRRCMLRLLPEYNTTTDHPYLFTESTIPTTHTSTNSATVSTNTTNTNPSQPIPTYRQCQNVHSIDRSRRHNKRYD